MSNPTTAVEWEKHARKSCAHWNVTNGPCSVCLTKALDAHARQQVEAFRERLMPFVIHRVSCPQAGRNYIPDKFFDANIAKCTCGLAAAIRALER